MAILLGHFFPRFIPNSCEFGDTSPLFNQLHTYAVNGVARASLSTRHIVSSQCTLSWQPPLVLVSNNIIMIFFLWLVASSFMFGLQKCKCKKCLERRVEHEYQVIIAQLMHTVP